MSEHEPTTESATTTEQLMASGMSLLSKLDVDGGPSLESLIESFMDVTYELGVSLHAEPRALAADEVLEYRRASAELLAPYQRVVQHSVDRTVQRFSSAFQLDEWQLLCRRRSALAFLQELSASTSFEVGAMTIDLSALDGLIIDVGIDEGGLPPERIPAGVPVEHWWWWYPEAPPEEADAT